MIFDTHKNLSLGTILTAPTPASSGTTFVLNPGDGQFFAANMPCTLAPAGVVPTYDNAEVGYITAVSTDTLTIARAQEGTLAKSVQAGWVAYGSITAKTVQDLEDALQGLATVATTGSYDDLTNKPTIPGGDKYFKQDFTTTTTLSVAHNLNKRPAVTVVDSAGDEVIVDIRYVDDNNLTLNLAGGFSGSVYCN